MFFDLRAEKTAARFTRCQSPSEGLDSHYNYRTVQTAAILRNIRA